MAVLMGRLDGGLPARIFASLIFRIHFLGGPRRHHVVRSSRIRPSMGCSGVWAVGGAGGFDHLCGYNLLEEKGVFPRDMGGCSTTCGPLVFL